MWKIELSIQALLSKASKRPAALTLRSVDGIEYLTGDSVPMSIFDNSRH